MKIGRIVAEKKALKCPPQLDMKKRGLEIQLQRIEGFVRIRRKDDMRGMSAAQMSGDSMVLNE
jgi:hypothetical protein